MECVEGETLAKRLEKGPLQLEQVLKYGVQIADALDKAHRAGIVHRDLKPGNIMLTASGAKLLDFGLAKPSAALVSGITLTAEATKATPVTQEGVVVGTFQYMSPEQVEGNELDARSDIFSLGAVLYEMVTGKRAFEGKSQLSVASAILEKEPAPITSAKPLTPPALDHAIRRCLAKDPEERWQTARDLGLELKWIPASALDSRSMPVLKTHVGRGLAIYAALATIASLTFAGLLWHRSAQPRPMLSPVRFTLDMPASDPVAVKSGPVLAFAPDAGRIAYVVVQGGTTQLLLRELNAIEGKLLAGTEGATAPFFSPDGQWIGFYAEGKLKKVPVTGGPTMVLCEALEGNGATWLPDDTIVFSGDWVKGLQRVPATGGNPQFITHPGAQGEAFHWWPEALPGGRAVLFTVQKGPGGGGASIGALSLKSGEWRTVVEKGSDPHYLPAGNILLYLNEGALWGAPFDAEKLQVTGPAFPVLQGFSVDTYFSVAHVSLSKNGSIAYIRGTSSQPMNTLVKVDRAGHEQTLTDIRRGYEDLTLSPDGHFLAMTIMGDTWNAWLYDMGRGTLSRLTFEGDNRDPVWTADSKRVLYGSFRKGHFGIYWKPIFGKGAEEQLTATETEPWLTSCSPDGQECTYDLGASDPSSGIHLLPMAGEHKPTTLLAEPTAEAAAISPDGKWVAYESAESGRSEIYVRPFPSGAAKWQVSTEGGIRPKWSPNGRELFFGEVRSGVKAC